MPGTGNASRRSYIISNADMVVAHDIRDTILTCFPDADVEIVASLEAAMPLILNSSDLMAIFAKLDPKNPETRAFRNQLADRNVCLIALDAEWSPTASADTVTPPVDSEFHLNFPFTTDYLVDVLKRIPCR